ncbi:hypothetical protein BX265_8326 [Streptomyces sp. TLI_235]|nr:hypothetical protein [Streptomyces sp. TLI_235]PBC66267.1 hypothetical protein BX265_8326 [Streptomyces sp. TLI_235]
MQRRPLQHGGHAAPTPAADTDLVAFAAPTCTGAGTGAPRRLALAADRTSLPPAARGLGVPTNTWSAANNTLLIDGWESDPTLDVVRRPDGSPAGWVATVDDNWGTSIDGRLVIDATDHQSWYSQDARYAVSLLRMALDQHLA